MKTAVFPAVLDHGLSRAPTKKKKKVRAMTPWHVGETSEEDIAPTNQTRPSTPRSKLKVSTCRRRWRDRSLELKGREFKSFDLMLLVNCLVNFVPTPAFFHLSRSFYITTPQVLSLNTIHNGERAGRVHERVQRRLRCWRKLGCSHRIRGRPKCVDDRGGGQLRSTPTDRYHKLRNGDGFQVETIGCGHG